MARHVDPEDTSFRRSLLRALGGGVLAMVVTFAITAALTLVGRDDAPAGPAVQTPAAVAQQPTPEPTAGPPATQPPAPEPTQTPPTEAPTEQEQARPPAQVTVQVLDTVGSGTGPDAVEAAAVLRQLGYDVVAVNPTRRSVATTTVLVTSGSEPEARALVRSDERFAESTANDGFAESVDLHVLVAPGDFAE